MRPPLRRELLIAALAFLAIACSGDSDGQSPGSTVTPSDSQTPEQAIAEAEEAFRLEGILTGEVVESEAKLTTLGDADKELTEWGAVLASYTDYPPLNTPVWLVRILAYGKEPGPPGAPEPPEQCTDMRAIVTVDPFEDFGLFGKPSDEC